MKNDVIIFLVGLLAIGLAALGLSSWGRVGEIHTAGTLQLQGDAWGIEGLANYREKAYVYVRTDPKGKVEIDVASPYGKDRIVEYVDEGLRDHTYVINLRAADSTGNDPGMLTHTSASIEPDGITAVLIVLAGATDGGVGPILVCDADNERTGPHLGEDSPVPIMRYDLNAAGTDHAVSGFILAPGRSPMTLYPPYTSSGFMQRELYITPTKEAPEYGYLATGLPDDPKRSEKFRIQLIPDSKVGRTFSFGD